MANPKLAAVRNLEAALVVAAEAGLFDDQIPSYLHPDCINKFCDAITEVRKDMESGDLD